MCSTAVIPTAPSAASKPAAPTPAIWVIAGRRRSKPFNSPIPPGGYVVLSKSFDKYFTVAVEPLLSFAVVQPEHQDMKVWEP
jgi:hypothetical protein